ncbi:hypothetical protein BH23VER1_BH23VER1_33860 [soil metagenome]
MSRKPLLMRTVVYGVDPKRHRMIQTPTVSQDFTLLYALEHRREVELARERRKEQLRLLADASRRAFEAVSSRLASLFRSRPRAAEPNRREEASSWLARNGRRVAVIVRSNLFTL